MDSGVEVRLAVPEIEAEMNTQEWAILTDVISNIGMSKVGAIGNQLRDDANSISGTRPDKIGMSRVDAQGQIQEWGLVCWQMQDCTLTFTQAMGRSACVQSGLRVQTLACPRSTLVQNMSLTVWSRGFAAVRVARHISNHQSGTTQADWDAV